MANTYLPVALAAMLTDSLIDYPWNVLATIIVYTFLQNVLKRLAHYLHVNPPFDDVQHCQFLVAAASVFIFDLSTMITAVLFLHMQASMPSDLFQVETNF